MILLWFIVVLLGGGLLAWAAERAGKLWARWIALAAVTADFLLAVALWVHHAGRLSFTGQGAWLEELDWIWIPHFGIRFHLAMDGMSLLLLVLTFFLGIVAVLASWTEIQERVGLFHFNLLWVLAGITGVFTALDLFLFYFAWELMLVPMYFLIALWGHERRIYSAIKFFLFTQLSGLLMLIAILALYFIHHDLTGVYTFDYTELLGTPLGGRGLWIMLGFFIAFAVKLPMVPFHTWLPDAHTDAPTAGSVVLAGLLLKTGAYGLLRFVLPLFPEAAEVVTPAVMVLAVIGILYGAVLAFGQTDVKRLVAYTSISHLGFVLLGIFAGNKLALQGALFVMICHGISTGGLFVIAGLLQERMHTREMARMGGLWAVMPRLSGSAMVLAMASIGLPGLGDFVGEFLVLLGTYRASIPLAVLAAVGVLVSTIYGLRMIQRAFHGENQQGWKLPDLAWREALVMLLMIVSLVWLGLHPQPVLDTADPVMNDLEQTMHIERVRR